MLAAATPVTRTITLGTAALLPVLRRPVQTAQALGAPGLPVGGRLVVTVGAGFPGSFGEPQRRGLAVVRRAAATEAGRRAEDITCTTRTASRGTTAARWAAPASAGHPAALARLASARPAAAGRRAPGAVARQNRAGRPGKIGPRPAGRVRQFPTF